MRLPATIVVPFLSICLLVACDSVSPEPSETTPPEPPDRFVEVVTTPNDKAEAAEGSAEQKLVDEENDTPSSPTAKVDNSKDKKVEVKNIGVNKSAGSEEIGKKPLKNMFAKSGEGSDAIKTLGNLQGSSSGEAKGLGGLGIPAPAAAAVAVATPRAASA